MPASHRPTPWPLPWPSNRTVPACCTTSNSVLGSDDGPSPTHDGRPKVVAADDERLPPGEPNPGGTARRVAPVYCHLPQRTLDRDARGGSEDLGEPGQRHLEVPRRPPGARIVRGRHEEGGRIAPPDLARRGRVAAAFGVVYRPHRPTGEQQDLAGGPRRRLPAEPADGGRRHGPVNLTVRRRADVESLCGMPADAGRPVAPAQDRLHVARPNRCRRREVERAEFGRHAAGHVLFERDGLDLFADTHAKRVDSRRAGGDRDRRRRGNRDRRRCGHTTGARLDEQAAERHADAEEEESSRHVVGPRNPHPAGSARQPSSVTIRR